MTVCTMVIFDRKVKVFQHILAAGNMQSQYNIRPCIIWYITRHGSPNDMTVSPLI